MRAVRSVVPPGAKGTTMRTGLLGQSAWAQALAPKARAAASSRALRRFSGAAHTATLA